MEGCHLVGDGGRQPLPVVEEDGVLGSQQLAQLRQGGPFGELHGELLLAHGLANGSEELHPYVHGARLLPALPILKRGARCRIPAIGEGRPRVPGGEA